MELCFCIPPTIWKPFIWVLIFNMKCAEIQYEYKVRYLYNAVLFLTNIYERHPIARPLGRHMECRVWIQHLIDILPHFL